MVDKYTWDFTLSDGRNTLRIEPPVEWADITLEASFEEFGMQLLSVDQFTFTNKSYSFIKNIIDTGNIFTTSSLRVELITVPRSNNNNYVSSPLVKNYALDFTNVKFYEYESKLTIGLTEQNSSFSMVNKLNANTFLEFFDDNDNIKSEYSYIMDTVQVLVDKENTTLEQIVLYLTIYQLTIQIIEQTTKLIERVGDLTSLFVAGNITGPAAVALKAAANVIIQGIIVYGVTRALIILLKRLQELLFPIPTDRKVFNLGRTTEAIVDIISSGSYPVKFINMDEIYDYYYLPSNISVDLESVFSNPIMVNPSDYGYMFSEFFSLIKSLFECRAFLIDDVIYIGNENEDFFYNKSTYVLPPTLLKDISYNVGDFDTKEFYSFKTDLSDEYTTSNYRGTSFEIDNIIKGNTEISSLKDVNHSVGLSSRKNKLSILQTLFDSVLDVMNGLLGVFSGRGLTSDTFFDKQIGMIKVSSRAWSVPKLVKLNSSLKLDRNHSGLTSAKHFYDNYNYKSSFTLPRNRRKLYTNVRVEFDREDYVKLKKSNVFTTDKNETGRITSLKWNVQGDYADIEYYIVDGYDIKKLTRKFTEV